MQSHLPYKDNRRQGGWHRKTASSARRQPPTRSNSPKPQLQLAHGKQRPDRHTHAATHTPPHTLRHTHTPEPVA